MVAICMRVILAKPAKPAHVKKDLSQTHLAWLVSSVKDARRSALTRTAVIFLPNAHKSEDTGALIEKAGPAADQVVGSSRRAPIGFELEAGIERQR